MGKEHAGVVSSSQHRCQGCCQSTKHAREAVQIVHSTGVSEPNAGLQLGAQLDIPTSAEGSSNKADSQCTWETGSKGAGILGQQEAM